MRFEPIRERNAIASLAPGQRIAGLETRACNPWPLSGTSNLLRILVAQQTSVVNFYSIESAQDYVAGWVYTTEHGQQFWEGNANAVPTLDAFANAFTAGLTSAILNAVNNP